MTGLGAEDLARYDADGYLFPVRVTSGARAAGYRAQFEESERAMGGRLAGGYAQKLHLLFRWADELVREPALLDAIESILGPDLLLWSTELFAKDPGDGRFVSWHADDTYWHFEPLLAVNAWIALADAPLEAGPLRYVRGSHRDPTPAVRNAPSALNMLQSGQIAQGVDESRAVDVVLAAGEAAFHQPRTLHGSLPNRGRDRRIGLAARYIPTRVRQLGARETAMLVRGADRHGHFDLEPRPCADLDAAARAAHRDAVERRMANFRGGEFQGRPQLG